MVVFQPAMLVLPEGNGWNPNQSRQGGLDTMIFLKGWFLSLGSSGWFCRAFVVHFRDFPVAKLVKKVPPCAPQKRFPQIDIIYTQKKRHKNLHPSFFSYPPDSVKLKRTWGKKQRANKRGGVVFFLKCFLWGPSKVWVLDITIIYGANKHAVSSSTCFCDVFSWGGHCGGVLLDFHVFFVVGDMFCLWPCFAKFDICKVDYDNMVCLRNRAA